MRIIGGNIGGIRINTPKNLKLRPTTDRCKESIFNILQNEFDFNNVEVLDLFAGTGNISYEFSSRGAKKVISIDNNTKCINFIKNFSQKQSLNIETIKSDAYNYLKIINLKFDIIYADPPYHFKFIKYNSLITKIFDNKILKNDGIIVIEHSSKNDLSTISNFVQYRKYGDTTFSFFKNLNN